MDRQIVYDLCTEQISPYCKSVRKQILSPDAIDAIIDFAVTEAVMKVTELLKEGLQDVEKEINDAPLA